MKTYSTTLPMLQAKLFEEVLNQLGFTTFRNEAGVGMLGLTLRYERQEDLDAAYGLYRDVLAKCKDETDLFVMWSHPADRIYREV